MALLFSWLAGALCAAVEPGPPPHPQLLEPSRAPAAAKILNQVALAYDPQMSEADRERDFLGKVSQAKEHAGAGEAERIAPANPGPG